MLHFGRLWFVVLLLACPSLQAQVPGAYPHLVLSDGMGLDVPGASDPFDNSGVFPAVNNQVVELTISYEALAQPNELVFWGLLFSAQQTPAPVDLIPPPLFTQPPFVLLDTGAMLDAQGEGGASFTIPAGLYTGEVFLQAVVLDNSSVPRVQLSNGVTVSLEPPGFNVSYSFTLNAAGDERLFRMVGVTDIDPVLGSNLKPLGDQPAPMPTPSDPGVNLGQFRFLEILPNTPDGPVSPLSRPLTRLEADLGSNEDEIIVADTTGFPRTGRILVPLANSDTPTETDNLWKNIGGSLSNIPNAEVIEYDGLEQDRFFVTKRAALGTKRSSSIQVEHSVGQVVVGEYSMVSSPGVRTRTRVSLDATNRDAPRVVIPAFSFTPTTETCIPPADGGGGPVTMDLDLYRFEISSNEAQGFMVLDRTTHTWRVIPGTQRLPDVGTWNPIVSIAPDRRSMIAGLKSGPSSNSPGSWNNGPDQFWAIRLDGEVWPATCEQTWQLTYELQQVQSSNVQSRRIVMESTFIVGSGPDNYVMFGALAHKWRVGFIPGLNFVPNVGSEADYVRQETFVRDLIAVPLTPPGSGKGIPTFPRPYMTPQFQTTGFGNAVDRFDPQVLVSKNADRLLITGGSDTDEEDVFLIRDIQIDPSGEPDVLLLNLSGHRNAAGSAGQQGVQNMRPFMPSGGGQGLKACFSPDESLAAWLSQDGSRRDWIQIATTDGLSFGNVLNVYQDTTNGDFREPGAYVADRIVTGMRFADDDTLVFLMGRNQYDDPFGVQNPANGAALEVFAYHITDDLMVNLSETSGTQFAELGALGTAGFLSSPSDAFSYFIRAGGVGLGSPTLPEGTPVLNVVGISHSELAVFDVTGDEFGGTSLVPNLVLPADEVRWPVENVAPMQFIEGDGVQAGMVYFVAHQVGGNGADDIYAFNRDAPFINLPITSALTPGVHVNNVVPNPFSAKVGFARTDSTDPTASRQHPFVVDLNNFLFERDVLPTYQSGGAFFGRVMDGSLAFVPATGSAGDAMVFAFGLQSLQPFGIAQICAPTYYPLATVSDPLIEPIPVTIPITDTLLLGSDFRFYLHAVTPFNGPTL